MKMVKQICRCGKTFHARQADINRGWGKTCSKACAAKKRASSNGNKIRRIPVNLIDDDDPSWDAHKYV
jgi:hypothetical protein